MKNLKAAALIALSLLTVLQVARYVEKARANVSCSVPFNLQNNTTADATQVNANFAALISCLGSAAAAGVNSDITQLTGLTTPLSAPQGGTTVFVGGTSTGSANSQVVTPTTPTSFTLTTGNKLVFISGFSNTGATTIAVGSTGAKNIYRQTSIGLQPLVGGELNNTMSYTLTWDGTQYELEGRFDNIGEIKDFAGGVPAGWLVANGVCVSQTGVNAALFAYIGSVWGSCPAGQFALPQTQGRSTVNAGGPACGGFGSTCGAGTITIVQANLPNITLTTNITDPGHSHGMLPGGTLGVSGAGGFGPFMTTLTSNTNSATTGITASTPLGGSGTAISITPLVTVVNKVIKL